MQKPLPGEYPAYAIKYIDLIQEEETITFLQQNQQEVILAFSVIGIQDEDHAYDTGKWTIKQVLQHVVDTERVFAYRALVAARQDKEHIVQSMDENHYAANADVSGRTLRDIIEEFIVVRNSTIHLYKSITPPQCTNILQSGELMFSTRALAYMMAGHARHHINILQERYLK